MCYLVLYSTTSSPASQPPGFGEHDYRTPLLLLLLLLLMMMMVVV